jgi:UDP-N-acetyl-alpha-D-muramoyl-L-alanyl-L-glutamate epimerase
MVRSSRSDKYQQLRLQFPFFAFEKQEYDLTSAGLEIRYTFNLADKYFFHPSLFIPRKSFFVPDEFIAGRLDNIVFNIGMIELISYWKAACPPILIIRPFMLQAGQVSWWKKLYFNGLGEFFYLNSIPADEESFVTFQVASDLLLKPEGFNLDDALLIPVGGGKDSAVTLELLGMRRGALPLIMNPRGASLETIAAMGFGHDRYFEIRRSLDPLLLQLNEQGFLNGHTPFSALLAFVTVLASVVSGRRHIALSNESSASEVTIEGTEINHQYSKSFRFESDFREYIHQWVSKDVNYFSFLRPLNELQIASIFSQFPKYHPLFKSCNAGSRTDSWCCKCAKCLFTYIMLAPFLIQDDLVQIFGKELFEDPRLVPILDQLAGIADEKPFDCVGTVAEVNLALAETIRKWEGAELPLLLAYYKQSAAYSLHQPESFTRALSEISVEHNLPPEFSKIIMYYIQIAR